MSLCDIQTANLRATLKALLNMMIPPNTDFGMPGGAEVGFENSLESQDLEWINHELPRLNSVSFARCANDFHLTKPCEQQATIDDIKSDMRPFFNRLMKRLLEFYYIQPKVAKAIGLREGPPFPGGYLVDDGDLTLLESVYYGPKKFLDI